MSNNDRKTLVCKTFLINTFDIAERTIRTVIVSIVTDNGVVALDQRCKHGQQQMIDPEVLESIRQHIKGIPRMESHYVRAKTSREFIDGGLTIAELHRNYEAQRQEANKQSANYETYSRVFNKEFNISFFSPRKD